MRVLLVVCLCSGIIHGLWAQVGDTTRALDVRDKPKFILNFDARRQQVDGRIVRFFGARACVQHRRDIYAIGLYGLGDPLFESAATLPGPGLDSVDLRSTLGYVSATYERILLDTRRWQLSVPAMLGYGEAVLARDSADVWLPYRRTPVIQVETGVRSAFKVFFWLYVQGGIGYRRVLSGNARVTEDFSGLTWNFGLSIKLGKIYKYARDKIGERRERKKKDDGTQ